MSISNIFSIFRAPSAEQRVLVELEQAKCALLEALTAFEYSRSIVQYNTERVARLKKTAAYNLDTNASTVSTNEEKTE